MKKPYNPFIIAGYAGPDYFCDRKSETDRLLKAISSKRHVTLISLRRIGKTGLLHHVEHLVGKNKQPAVVIYVDLMPTTNGNDLLAALSSALLQVRKDENGFWEKILTVLSRMRPRLTYDSLTGKPAVELTIDSVSEVQTGFTGLLQIMSEIEQELIVMFDEFQQITHYPEKNIEHILRTVIQLYPSVSFIFSGSSKHMLEAMFASATRPFYQSSELMYLDKIPEDEYSSFIIEKFKDGGKKITAEVLSEILRWTRAHTFYVQHVCNRLYESEQAVINEELLNHTFLDILNLYDPLYSGYRKLIPQHQFKMLQAIASGNGVSQPTAGHFIKKYSLVNASSVNSSVKALAEKELIVRDKDQWLIYDVFFSRWLEYHYKKE